MENMPPYAVSLENWPELPPSQRIAAEVRYAAELEHSLGTPEEVRQAWWADFGPFEEADAVAREKVPPRNSRWMQAQQRADRAGWDGLPNRPTQAFFHVWVEWQDVLETSAQQTL